MGGFGDPFDWQQACRAGFPYAFLVMLPICLPIIWHIGRPERYFSIAERHAYSDSRSAAPDRAETGFYCLAVPTELLRTPADGIIADQEMARETEYERE